VLAAYLLDDRASLVHLARGSLERSHVAFLLRQPYLECGQLRNEYFEQLDSAGCLQRGLVERVALTVQPSRLSRPEGP